MGGQEGLTYISQAPTMCKLLRIHSQIGNRPDLPDFPQFIFQDTRVFSKHFPKDRLTREKQKVFVHFTQTFQTRLLCEKFLFNLYFARFYQSIQLFDFYYVFRKYTSDKVGDSISIISVKDCCWFPRILQAYHEFNQIFFSCSSHGIGMFCPVVSERERIFC